MVKKRILLGFISIILLLILTSSSSLLGNDFVAVNLRTDISEVMRKMIRDIGLLVLVVNFETPSGFREKKYSFQ